MTTPSETTTAGLKVVDEIRLTPFVRGFVCEAASR
jgi:hypothetical protein